jgi:WD40 repeat protein
MSNYSPYATLTGHDDAVSIIRFRPLCSNLCLLASIGMDGRVIFWDMYSPKHNPTGPSFFPSNRPPGPYATQTQTTIPPTSFFGSAPATPPPTQPNTPATPSLILPTTAPPFPFDAPSQTPLPFIPPHFQAPSRREDRRVATMVADSTRRISLTSGEWNCAGNVFTAAGKCKYISLWSVEDVEGRLSPLASGLEPSTEASYVVAPELETLVTIFPVCPLTGHIDYLTYLAFAHRDAYLLLSLSEDGTLRLWDLTKSRHLDETLLPEALRERSVSTRASKAIKVADGRCVRIYNLASYESFPPFTFGPEGVTPGLDVHSIKK